MESCQEVAASFLQRLTERVRKSGYYSHLYRLLGNDGGIEQQSQLLKEQVCHALVSAAQVECDRYVRESPRFYAQGTFSIYQFRQTLQQTSQGYDAESIVEAEPAIRQLLKLDFEPKVSQTVRRTFHQTINMTIKSHLLPAAEQRADEILQQYNHARAYLEQTLEKEAEDKIANYRRLQSQVKQNIEAYNQAVTGINNCLQAMQLSEHLLPAIGLYDIIPVSLDPDAFTLSPAGNGVSSSSQMMPKDS